MKDKYVKMAITIEMLKLALKPLAAIADEYDANGLDEARPDWVARGVTNLDLDIELFSGRGGKTLLTLRHAIHAREVLSGKEYNLPTIDPFIAKVRQMYEASIPNLPWDSMAEDRKVTIIENYRRIIGR